MAVALIALFVSLGGVSYGVATGSITGKAVKNNTIGTKDLKNNDIRGRDIRNNTLTGSDVNESKLGKVPRAGSADSASSAANASQLGGQPPSAYQARAIAKSSDAQIDMSSASGPFTLVTLSLPAGSYAISAKLDLNGTSIPPATIPTITCNLVAGTDSDQTQASLDPPGPAHASVALQAVHTDTTAFAALVKCSTNTIGGGMTLTADGAKITALPVASLTNQS